MNVNLNNLVVAYNNYAVADCLEEHSKLVGVGVDTFISADNKLGTICKVDNLVELSYSAREIIELFLYGSGITLNNLAVLKVREHTLENRVKSHSARVYNASFL